MSDESDPEVEREKQHREAFAEDEEREATVTLTDFERLLDARKPRWWDRLMKYDERTLKAWDERIRRFKKNIATDEDKRIHDEAVRALGNGEALSMEARRMPREFPKKDLTAAQHAVSVGIPPLIAEAITDGKVKVTRSVKACERVGIDYTVLVLCGERGCGKTYAAADWLIMTQHRVPAVLEKKVSATRFLEASLLVEVPYEERTHKLGYARALVIDDM